MHQNILALIPARGGSKGIPCKNLYPLAGKPLIAWTIDVALHARCFTRIVVSTDSREIADAAIRLGAEVPFLRPEELARDNSLMGHVIDHVLGGLRETGFQTDILVELYPTHPFRTVRMVRDLTARLENGAAQASTVRPVSMPWDHLLTLDANGGVVSLADSVQAFPAPAFRRYGLFNGWRVNPELSSRGHAHPVVNPVELIDIDTPKDMRVAEAVLNQHLYDFGIR